MSEQFGVIVNKKDDTTTVLYEGDGTKLFNTLEVVKQTICPEAELKLVDKNEYEDAKESITELNKLLKI